MLALLLFNIFFAAVIKLASTRFKADKGIMDALVHLRKKRGAGGRGGATVGDSVLATPLWGMLYADDAGVVSQSPQQLRKMMGVIVVVCAAFGLTVSEAKTEIMCLHARGMPECLHIKGRLNEGPRLQRKHKDENEVKQNKRNTRERRHDICKPNTRRTQGRATCG